MGNAWKYVRQQGQREPRGPCGMCGKRRHGLHWRCRAQHAQARLDAVASVQRACIAALEAGRPADALEGLRRGLGLLTGPSLAGQ